MKVTANQRFGRLTTVRRIGSSADKHAVWLCSCDCGAACERQSNNLQAAALHSCGCARSELAKTHGMRGTTTYSSWRSAIERCHNKSSKDYSRYGAVGISVCEKWRKSFEAFLTDMGERPSGTSLDRWPDQRGGYEPGNCRWATPQQQARNRSNFVVVKTPNGEMPLVDYAKSIGLTKGAAHLRLKRGKLEGVSYANR